MQTIRAGLRAKTTSAMPFVRIDLRKGKGALYLQDIGQAVYEALVG